jgi:hypothetical protein
MKVDKERIESQRNITKRIEAGRDELIERFKRENKLLILMEDQYKAEQELEKYEAEYRESAVRGMEK